ncbi:MAG: hypothetical protein FWE33_03270 [Defluviitaleaceae bacterium]|nr:hypothetical protein [Defluviitaleaceae bacterium]
MNEKKNYDEMQSMIRGKIGNQMFFVVVFIVLIDGLLHARGIVWWDFDYSVWAITVFCTVIYVVRVIVAGAYFPANFSRGNPIAAIIVSAVMPVAALLLILQPVWLEGWLYNITWMAMAGCFIYTMRNIIMRKIKK